MKRFELDVIQTDYGPSQEGQDRVAWFLHVADPKLFRTQVCGSTMRTEHVGKGLLLERSTMGSHKVANGLGGSPGDLADNAIYAGENPVLAVDGDCEKVLD